MRIKRKYLRRNNNAAFVKRLGCRGGGSCVAPGLRAKKNFMARTSVSRLRFAQLVDLSLLYLMQFLTARGRFPQLMIRMDGNWYSRDSIQFRGQSEVLTLPDLSHTPVYIYIYLNSAVLKVGPSALWAFFFSVKYKIA